MNNTEKYIDYTVYRTKILELFVNIDGVNFTILYDTGYLNNDIKSKEYVKTLHQHVHSHYEVFCFKTPPHFIIEDEEIQASPNSMIIIPPGTKHLCRIKEYTSDTRMLALNFMYEKTNHKSAIPLYDILNNILSSPYTILPATDETYEIISAFDSDYASSDVKANAALSLKFHKFVNYIIDHAPLHTLNLPLHIEDSKISRAYQINMIMTRYYDKNINMKDVADSLKVSTRQLSRIMHSEFGCSFKDCIVRYRMNVAKELTETTDMNFTEISSKVGYNSTKPFYVAFRKYFGCLPGEYRSKK